MHVSNKVWRRASVFKKTYLYPEWNDRKLNSCYNSATSFVNVWPIHRNPHTQLCSGLHSWGCRHWNQGGFCLLRHGHDGTACQGTTSFDLDNLVYTSFIAWRFGRVGVGLPRDVHWEECGAVGHSHTLGPSRLHAVRPVQHPQPGLRQADTRRIGGRNNEVHRHCPWFSGTWTVSSQLSTNGGGTNVQSCPGWVWGWGAGKHQQEPDELRCQSWGGESQVSLEWFEI